MPKRFLPAALVVAVALLTIAGNLLLYRAKERKYLIPDAATIGTQLKINPAHVRGNSAAPVTLEEFADFQCPACQLASGVVHQIENEYGDKLRVVFWHFPLAMHSHGREAALAVEAASVQGHFWQMHDLFYQRQADWSPASDAQPLFKAYAKEVGLNIPRWEADAGSAIVADHVEAERQYGVARKIQNTPAIFVNGHFVTPPYSPEKLHEAIDVAVTGGAKH